MGSQQADLWRAIVCEDDNKDYRMAQILACTGKEGVRIFLTVSASTQKKGGGRDEIGLDLNCALPMSAKLAWCTRRVDRSIYGVVTGES